MKANAPEKLYIALNEFTEGERTFVLNHRVDYPICTEYIRTDSFVEKATEWLRDNYLKYPSEDCADTTKFVMDFKKYMKEE